MGRAVLTEYLLKLATNQRALEKHRTGTRAERNALMDKAKLAPKQKAALHSGDRARILEAVRAELVATASFELGRGTPVTFEMACCVGMAFLPASTTKKR